MLANITCNAQATTSLVLKSALLSWIEMQVTNCRNLEAVAWVRILENIMVIVDPSKVESATGGAWREAILRCLLTLLEEATPSESSSIFPILELIDCAQKPLDSIPSAR